jgi:hypothetical protein
VLPPMENCILFEDIHRGICFNPYREDLLHDQWLKSLPQIGLSPKDISPEKHMNIVKFLFESFSNIYDHAFRKPFDPPMKSSFCRIDKEEKFFGLKKYLHIYVSDSGVGIPARQSLDPDIYKKEINKEKTFFYEAMCPNGSSKIRAQDCRINGSPGYGSLYVCSSLKKLGASASIETGRLRAKFNKKTGLFEIKETLYRAIHGTTIIAKIPI